MLIFKTLSLKISSLKVLNCSKHQNEKDLFVHVFSELEVPPERYKFVESNMYHKLVHIIYNI